tara:strand:+ start:808 stop:2463 length:1656 start_codon:yes stop_codon:yes gene_type:complete
MASPFSSLDGPQQGMGRGAIPLLAVTALLGLQFFLAVELFSVNIFIGRSEPWAQVPLHRGEFVRCLILQVALILFLARPRLRGYWQRFIEVSRDRAYLPMMILQCLAFLLACGFASVVYTDPFPFDGWQWPIVLAWCLAATVAVALSFLVLAPIRFWQVFLRQEATGILVTSVLILGYMFFLRDSMLVVLEQLWRPESDLRQWTLLTSAAWLKWFYPTLLLDVQESVMGTREFLVLISWECSGLEGAALLSILVCVYLYAFRTYLKFPAALCLLLIAVPMSLGLNVVRIVALVIIGIEVSPEWAIKGFHTYGGVVMLMLECGVLLFLSQTRWFSKQAPAYRFELDFETCLLLPLLCLLAMTLVTGLLTVEFAWLYPLRVLVVGLVIALCWKPLRSLLIKPSLMSVGAGVAVFLIWIALVPGSAEADAEFSTALNAAPTALAVGWLFFRVIGAVVTVPIAEELAFRGYLLTVLSKRAVLPQTRLPFQWVAFLGSSMLFAALHGQWIAGLFAGMAYALVRYHTGRISDAVISHATTNGLLALYVLLTGQWSYW